MKAYEAPVADRLIASNYTLEEIPATGLFEIRWAWLREVYPDDTPLSEFDPLPAINDEDSDIEAENILNARWTGRVVFPAFDAEGACRLRLLASQKGTGPSRQLSERLEVPQTPRPRVIYAHKPNYGADTLESCLPTIITEGVADAIAAIDAGFPVLSPVTTQFKEAHHDDLLALIEAHDIPAVYLIQDNEPGTFEVIAPGDRD